MFAVVAVVVLAVAVLTVVLSMIKDICIILWFNSLASVKRGAQHSLRSPLKRVHHMSKFLFVQRYKKPVLIIDQAVCSRGRMGRHIVCSPHEYVARVAMVMVATCASWPALICCDYALKHEVPQQPPRTHTSAYCNHCMLICRCIERCVWCAHSCGQGS